MRIVNRQPVKHRRCKQQPGQMWSELMAPRLLRCSACGGGLFRYRLGGRPDRSVHLARPGSRPVLPAGIPAVSLAAEARSQTRIRHARLSSGSSQDPAVPKLPYRLILIENPKPNAFAFPGGTIGLTSGLIDSLDDPEALKFVLGHELGHFHERGHLRGLGRAIGSAVVFSILFGGDMGRFPVCRYIHPYPQSLLFPRPGRRR